MSNHPEKRFLVIRLSSLGDILLTTPLIRSLKRKFPHCVIDYLVKSVYTGLLEGNPYIDNLLCFEEKNGFAEIIKWRRQIRREKYDRLFDLHANLRSKLMTVGLWETPVRRMRKRLLPRFALVHFHLNIYSKSTTVTDRYYETSDKFKLKYDGEGLDLFLNENTESLKRDVSESQLRVVIAPGAGYYTKRWEEEKFSSLADLLIEREGAEIIFLGDKNDREVSDRITAEMKNAAIDVVGGTTITQAAAIINESDALISNDSGLMHIGVALKKPVLAFFGSTTEELGFFPYYTRNEVLQVQNLSCRPCSAWGKKSCSKKHFRCMKDISVSDAYDGFRRLISMNYLHGEEA